MPDANIFFFWYQNKWQMKKIYIFFSILDLSVFQCSQSKQPDTYLKVQSSV